MLPDETKETSPATKSAFSRALERFAARQEERRRETRIGFIIDATGSRDATWEQAQTIQARMFRSVAHLQALRPCASCISAATKSPITAGWTSRAPWQRRWRALPAASA